MITMPYTDAFAQLIGPLLPNGSKEDMKLLSPGQSDHYLADDIFRCIFVNGNIFIFIKIFKKFVPKGSIG